MNKTENLFCTVKITNVPSELFNDAKFFLDKSTKAEELYELRRYQRAATIYFCAATEGGLNDIITVELKSKNRNLKKWESNLLKFITDSPDYKIDNDYFNLRKKLYNILPKIIIEKNINWNNNQIDEFEKFLELANMRNSIMHYSRKENIHNDNLDKVINKSENIVKSLFQKYINLGASVKMFSWLK